MRLGYDLCIFDLESNGPTGEIIEIGATIVTRKGNLLGSHQTFVRNINPILPEITELCNIKDEDLETAPPLSIAVPDFFSWAVKEAGTKNLVLASWSNWDTATLRGECEKHKIDYPFRGKTLDIKSVAVWMTQLCDKMEHGSEGLQAMLKNWELEFKGRPHSAYCDAWNTANLLKTIWSYYDTRNETLLETLRELGIAK